jgi:hypothetical protein
MAGQGKKKVKKKKKKKKLGSRQLLSGLSSSQARGADRDATDTDAHMWAWAR